MVKPLSWRMLNNGALMIFLTKKEMKMSDEALYKRLGMEHLLGQPSEVKQAEFEKRIQQLEAKSLARQQAAKDKTEQTSTKK
jgi:hypothetical protein